ncbi:MAG: hypothetical protein LBS21_00195 [Clostridiales bacterium]|jgi:predicted transposase YdaD|nr:hypothetical protein [Clostridiales bacterium]
MDLIDRVKAEGKVEGRVEGRAEGKVLAFHEMGISLSEIARRVGISLAEVNNILAAAS